MNIAALGLRRTREQRTMAFILILAIIVAQLVGVFGIPKAADAAAVASVTYDLVPDYKIYNPKSPSVPVTVYNDNGYLYYGSGVVQFDVYTDNLVQTANGQVYGLDKVVEAVYSDSFTLTGISGWQTLSTVADNVYRFAYTLPSTVTTAVYEIGLKVRFTDGTEKSLVPFQVITGYDLPPGLDGATTYLSGLNDLTNVTNLTLEKAGVAKIIFPGPINLLETDSQGNRKYLTTQGLDLLSSDLDFRTGATGIDSNSSFTTIPAKVYLYGINFLFSNVTLPELVVLDDVYGNEILPGTPNYKLKANTIGYDSVNQIVYFDVGGFSSYNIGPGLVVNNQNQTITVNSLLVSGSVQDKDTVLKVYDNNSLVTTIDFSGKTVGDWTYTLTGLTNGVHTIKVQADNGLVETTETFDVTVNVSSSGGDTTKPTVTGTTPANGATGIAVDTNLTVTFSEAMDDTSLAKSEIALTYTGGTVSDFTYSWNTGKTVLTIDSTSNLANNTTYTVTVNKNVYDLAGNPMQNDYSWSFTTVSSGGGGGTTTTGGGGSDNSGPAQVPVKEDPPKKNPDGSTTVEAKVSPDDFNKAFDANKAAKEFVVEIKQSADEKLAILPADAFSKLADRAASLVLKTDSANLTIPGGAVKIADLAKQLGVDASKVEIKISVKEVAKADADKVKESKIAGMNPVSKVLEFTMEAAANGKSIKIDAFGGKVVKGEFPFTTAEAANVKDKAKLSVFKLNEKTGKWVYVRSKAADGKVIFFTTTFSKYTIMEYGKTFADISTHWAKSEVELMASKFVVNGISSDKFAPEANVTRAQFAAMLVRALGLSTDSANAAKFKDVKSTDWFAADVAAAYQASLIQGFEDNTFKPNAQITRDQMAVMVTRALKAAGKDISVSKSEQDSQLAKFTDGSKIQSWAKAEVAAAAKAGIINGVTSTSFAPVAKATRAQSAAMLKRMMTTGELI